MRRFRLPLYALVGMVSAASTASTVEAQGVAVQVGRRFDDGGWTAFRLAWSRALAGPLGAQFGGEMLRGPGSDRLFGAALDATLFRGGRSGVYLVGGVGGGFGTGGAERWWRSWSAGAGYELFPLPFLSLGFEGRYYEMLPSHRAGAELGVRLGARFGAAPRATRLADADTAEPGRGAAASSPPRESAGTPLSTVATNRNSAIVRADADAVLGDVVRTAEGEIGRRYRLGGRGDPGDGFDCSGLIQYAYARLGISLPRRSVDQARQGREIDRRESELRPGDILTFASSGNGVTHVGLYMGDGRFIHSASAGVQISRLSRDDPGGRWWYNRWVGVRRIVEPAA